jgi:hypothetical protein
MSTGIIYTSDRKKVNNSQKAFCRMFSDLLGDRTPEQETASAVALEEVRRAIERPFTTDLTTPNRLELLGQVSLFQREGNETQLNIFSQEVFSV